MKNGIAGKRQESSGRILVVLTFAAIVGVVLLSKLNGLAAAVIIALSWALWHGSTLRNVSKRLLLLLPFGFGAVVFIPFTHGGEALIEAGRFHVSVEGAHLAASILLKMIAVNILISFLNDKLGRFEIIKNLRWLGIPPVMIELMSLLIRYLFLLVEEVQSMLKAQRSRGFAPERWWWTRVTLKRFGEMLGMLFIRAYQRSGRIYLSMLSRGGADGIGLRSSDHHQQRKVNRLVMELKHISYRYGDIIALKNVSLNIPRGAKITLMGPNGAGKSTLISLLNGLEQPEEGEILFNGEIVTPRTAANIRRSVGVVYQDPDDQIFSATIEEDVAFGPRNLGLTEAQVNERVQMALSCVGMRELAGRSPFELSYGQKRRVAIAGVLAMQPEVMILDEPMAFLDPKGKDDLQTLLESLHLMGITILVATHDVDFAAEWADSVVMLKGGELLISGSSELLFEDKWIEAAGLHLPRLARPFRLLKGIGEEMHPKTVKQAAQIIWRLMVDKEG